MVNLCKSEPTVRLVFKYDGEIQVCSLIMGNSVCILASVSVQPVVECKIDETAIVDPVAFIDNLKHIATSVRTHGEDQQTLDVQDTTITLCHTVRGTLKSQCELQIADASIMDQDASISEDSFDSNFGITWSLQTEVNRADFEQALRCSVSPKQTGVQLRFQKSSLAVDALFDNTKRTTFLNHKCNKSGQVVDLEFSTQTMKLCHSALLFLEQGKSKAQPASLFQAKKQKVTDLVHLMADDTNPMLVSAHNQRCKLKMLIGPKMQEE